MLPGDRMQTERCCGSFDVPLSTNARTEKQTRTTQQRPTGKHKRYNDTKTLLLQQIADADAAATAAGERRDETTRPFFSKKWISSRTTTTRTLSDAPHSKILRAYAIFSHCRWCALLWYILHSIIDENWFVANSNETQSRSEFYIFLILKFIIAYKGTEKYKWTKKD